MSEAERLSVLADEPMRRVLRRVHVNMPWERLGRFFDLILELRMSVEIGLGGEGMDRAEVEEIRRTSEALKERGCAVTLHGPFWGIEPGCLDPLVRQVAARRISQFLDLARVFHPIQMVCHTGFDPRHHVGHQEQWLSESRAFWERMAARAESMHIPLLLENVWEKDPSFHLALLKSIDSPFLGFCLDVGHQHSFSETPLLHWLEQLAGYLMEVHLHDNDGSHDHHWPIGDGTIDFQQLFDFLESRGMAPVLTVEPHSQADLVKTLRGLSPFLERPERSVLRLGKGGPEATGGC